MKHRLLFIPFIIASLLAGCSEAETLSEYSLPTPQTEVATEKSEPISVIEKQEEPTSAETKTAAPQEEKAVEKDTETSTGKETSVEQTKVESQSPVTKESEKTVTPPVVSTPKPETVQPKQEPKKEAVKTNPNLMSVPLVSVTDGDTIKVTINGVNESVRFLLVDTPETSHPRYGKQPYGDEAKAFTKSLLSGSTVLLEKDVSERDKYGRLLMYVYTPDGRSVQEELLKNGLARVAYVYAPNTKYVDKYYAIQKDAQNRGVGIWSVENYAQEDGYHPEAMNESTSSTTPTTSADAFEPDANGGCSGYIKGNNGSEKIYHVPSGSYYNNTKAEMCFKTETAAVEAGYRKSKR